MDPLYIKKDQKKIRVYHTHIEISPYELGENERFERMLSIWIDAEYRFDPIGYHVHNNILYIPRGVDTYILQKEFNSTPFIVRKPDEYEIITDRIDMKLPPKNRIQEESIDFLTGEGDFVNTTSYSQQALILDTGDGKTYTTTNAITKLKMKAIIITHQDKIKQQWIETFLSKTTVDKNRLINISGSDAIERIMKNRLEGDFYFVNHQTLNSYGKHNGWDAIQKFFKKISVGVKVFDEAHLSFKNVLLIDFFTNTKKTFYLTANFGRSDSKEERLFKKCFASVYKFGEHTKNYEEKRKHIVYVPVLYQSNPSFNQLQMASNMYGFSVLGFIKYALYEDYDNTMIHNFFEIFDIANRLEGKILITVPKIDDTKYIQDLIIKKYKNLNKTVMTINSKNSKEENDTAKIDADIICSTIKSCGTGVDIQGLRVVINLEPFSSNITTNQLSGRLREYSEEKDTYFFDLIDTAFPTCERQYKTKLSYLKKKCKAIKVMKL